MVHQSFEMRLNLSCHEYRHRGRLNIIVWRRQTDIVGWKSCVLMGAFGPLLTGRRGGPHQKSGFSFGLLRWRMRNVGVAIDASDATLLEHGVRFLPILTLRIDRVGIMAAAARDTVPSAQPGWVSSVALPDEQPRAFGSLKLCVSSEITSRMPEVVFT